jgi:hypothetical protein
MLFVCHCDEPFYGDEAISSLIWDCFVVALLLLATTYLTVLLDTLHRSTPVNRQGWHWHEHNHFVKGGTPHGRSCVRSVRYSR